MTKIKASCHIAIFFLFLGCSSNQMNTDDLSRNFTIYDTRDNQTISFENLIAILQTYDIILLGEMHDQKKHHLMQKKIIQHLSENQNITLVLEMLGSDATKKLQEAQSSPTHIKPNDLAQAIGWEKKWDYLQYKEIIEMAFFSENILLKEGNLSRGEIQTIYQGAMPLKGKLSTTNAVKQEIAELISNIHEAQDEALLPKLVAIQQYKDRRMADHLIHCNHPCILLAGNYHVSKKIGVPLHLQDFNSSKKIITIGLGETLQDSDSADFVILFDADK